MEYRFAKLADAKPILDYLNIVGTQSDNLLFGEEGLNISEHEEENIIAAMNQSAKSCMFIALDSDKVIGMGTLSENRRERISHQCGLAISVDKAYWGTGVSKKIMNALIQFAKERQVEIITLEVFEDNVRGVKLYEKYGFTKIGYFKNFAKIKGAYKHAILMNLYINNDEH